MDHLFHKIKLINILYLLIISFYIIVCFVTNTSYGSAWPNDKGKYTVYLNAGISSDHILHIHKNFSSQDGNNQNQTQASDGAILKLNRISKDLGLKSNRDLEIVKRTLKNKHVDDRFYSFGAEYGIAKRLSIGIMLQFTQLIRPLPQRSKHQYLPNNTNLFIKAALLKKKKYVLSIAPSVEYYRDRSYVPIIDLSFGIKKSRKKYIHIMDGTLSIVKPLPFNNGIKNKKYKISLNNIITIRKYDIGFGHFAQITVDRNNFNPLYRFSIYGQMSLIKTFSIKKHKSLSIAAGYFVKVHPINRRYSYMRSSGPVLSIWSHF